MQFRLSVSVSLLVISYKGINLKSFRFFFTLGQQQLTWPGIMCKISNNCNLHVTVNCKYCVSRFWFEFLRHVTQQSYYTIAVYFTTMTSFLYTILYITNLVNMKANIELSLIVGTEKWLFDFSLMSKETHIHYISVGHFLKGHNS